MNFDDVSKAVEEAKRVQRIVDNNTDQMIRLVVGRLKSCTTWQGVDALKAIKKELRSFDARDGKWVE